MVEIERGELQRIRSGSPDIGADSDADSDAAGWPLLVRVHFAADDPRAVIQRAKEVLACVLERTDSWPADEQWPELLPASFVQRCAPEHGPEWSAEEWLVRSQSMTPEGKAAHARQPWTLSGWLYYFDPSEGGMGGDRSWWWWDAGTDEPGTGWIDVATSGLPFGTGSLYWLIEACGGIDPSWDDL